jgi:uncharacterized membrane protein
VPPGVEAARRDVAWRERWRGAARWLLGLAFVGAGLNHFLHTAFYVGIMPPWLPAHLALVWISGVAEVALGAAVLVHAWSRWAGWGLVALTLAVSPANVHMALHPELFPRFSPVALWLRLPLQLALLAWIFWSACRRPAIRP